MDQHELGICAWGSRRPLEQQRALTELVEGSELVV